MAYSSSTPDDVGTKNSRRLGLFLSSALLFVGTTAAQSQTGQMQSTRQLMPVPAHSTFHDGRLAIDSGFTVTVCDSAGPRAQHGVDRALRRLEGRTGFTFARDSAKPSPVLAVCSKEPGAKVQALGEDESYSLKIDPKHAELRAETDIGILRGLE